MVWQRHEPWQILAESAFPSIAGSHLWHFRVWLVRRTQAAESQACSLLQLVSTSVFCGSFGKSNSLPLFGSSTRRALILWARRSPRSASQRACFRRPGRGLACFSSSESSIGAESGLVVGTLVSRNHHRVHRHYCFDHGPALNGWKHDVILW
jgi:hypothetical protein